MKKLMILFALVLGSTLTYAQQGYNSGANSNRGYNQGNRGQVTTNRSHRGNNGYRGNNNGYRGNNGYQTQRRTTTTRHYQGRGNGTSYRGGVTSNNRRIQNRVRWQNSSCGTFRIKMTQERRYTAGYYTYDRGCRRWIEPCYTWHTVCRERVYPNSCGW